MIYADESHRSQFGDMYTAIVKKTCLPLWERRFFGKLWQNKNPECFTTGQILEDQLHSYTIVDAINDKNVLTFRVDYIKTMDGEEEITDEMVWDINREKIL